MRHLIANSGIQFLTQEVTFNPAKPLTLSNGKPLRYSFYDETDQIDGTRQFGLLTYNDADGKYVPVSELASSDEAVLYTPDGREELDASGVVRMNPEVSTDDFTSYEAGDEGMITVNNLVTYRVPNPDGSHGTVMAFGILLDKWLPMPMYRLEEDGITDSQPMGWCRMKMQIVDPEVDKKTGKIMETNFSKEKSYRIVWAFDTQLDDEGLTGLRPTIYEGEESADFSLCNKVDQMIDFMSSGEDFHAFAEYIASILCVDFGSEENKMYKCYYIYFVNFIRLLGTPEITLHNNDNRKIPVDLVLDIGNSRTCGVLFEEGDFTKSKMLELRDLTDPWIRYENKSFDMRVVFRKADFGSDIVLSDDESLFKWRSFVRIGEEARRLVYLSMDDDGITQKTTNYSSPKRYLWDTKPYEGQWENLATVTDSFNIMLSNDIEVPVLSELFADDGTYLGHDDKSSDGKISIDEKKNHFSRSSLMTMALIEVFQHAIAQINSIPYREKWGDVDSKRYIRNVIVTCPTAMPQREQGILRQCAEDAYDALTHCIPGLPMATITPTAASIKKSADPYLLPEEKTWNYDEASCCQLVYLYAEIAQRYAGETDKFFELKGHVRPELAQDGYNRKALTIGSVDIGAGTTDLMICSYKYDGEGRSRVTPIPLFWDSFYLAGDDILRNIIQNLIIEGADHRMKDIGGVSAALKARIVDMTDEELCALPCLTDQYDEDGNIVYQGNIVYLGKVDAICKESDEDEKKHLKAAFASNLIHDFFGEDKAMMGYRDRRCRTDFNTQISVPIAQRYMELLRTHRPSKLYTFDELFPDVKPAKYLLEYFKNHFGFKFEELSWRFDPEAMASVVRTTMEPLMRQLALVLYSEHCDIIVLSGRPTSLDAITDLFIKYVPTSPDRLIRLNEYRIGSFFPTADGQGYFYDQKSIVAVGGMVAYLASVKGLKGFVLDLDEMKKRMHSTANYIGEYKSRRRQVIEAPLTPEMPTATLTINVFPAFLGCRQLSAYTYQARPLFAIYNHSKAKSLTITLSRETPEDVVIYDTTDQNGNAVSIKDVELRQQSITENGSYWLDKGEFELTIV